MKPLVSIIVLLYNKEKYIKQCIESLELKRNTNVECIVINDGSTDNSKKIIIDYMQSNQISNMKIFDQENSGHWAAFKTGLEKSTGKYVKILDADDYFNKEEFSSFLELIKDVDSDLIINHADFNYFKNNKIVNVRRKRLFYRFANNALSKTLNSQPITFDEIYDNKEPIWNMDFVGLHVITFKREYYLDFFKDIDFDKNIVFDDITLRFIILLNFKSAYFVDKTVYQYRLGLKEQTVAPITNESSFLKKFNSYKQNFIVCLNLVNSNENMINNKKRNDFMQKWFYSEILWSMWRLFGYFNNSKEDTQIKKNNQAIFINYFQSLFKELKNYESLSKIENSSEWKFMLSWFENSFENSDNTISLYKKIIKLIKVIANKLAKFKLLRFMMKYLYQHIIKKPSKNIPRNFDYLKVNYPKPLENNKVLFIESLFSIESIYKKMPKNSYEVYQYNLNTFTQEDFDYISKFKKIVVKEEFFFLSKLKENRKIIQLWHGTFAISYKKVAAECFITYDTPFNILISSWKNKNELSKIFNISTENIYVLGSEEIDEILEKRELMKNDKYIDSLRKKMNISNNIKKIYFWNFSFIEKPSFKINYFFDFWKIEQHLNDDEMIIYNLHPSFYKSGYKMELYCSNKIRHIWDFDTFSISLISNLMITDYSSTVFYCLYLDKPCLYVMESFKFYERGFRMKRKDFPGKVLSYWPSEKKIVKNIRKQAQNINNKKHKELLNQIEIPKNATNKIISFILEI